MTIARLMLFVLTALAGVGAIYFWAIHVAATAMVMLIGLVVCLVAGLWIHFRLPR